MGISGGTTSGSYQLGVSELDEVGPDVALDGALFGLRAGRNTSRGDTVFGVEIEGFYGPSGTIDQGTAAPDWSCTTGECNLTIENMIVARGRLGRSFWGTTLVYGAAGIGVATVDGGIENSSQQATSTAVGPNFGIGVERILPEGLTGFVELTAYDFGVLKLGETDSGDQFDAVGDFKALRVGVNLRF